MKYLTGVCPDRSSQRLIISKNFYFQIYFRYIWISCVRYNSIIHLKLSLQIIFSHWRLIELSHGIIHFYYTLIQCLYNRHVLVEQSDLDWVNISVILLTIRILWKFTRLLPGYPSRTHVIISYIFFIIYFFI